MIPPMWNIQNGQIHRKKWISDYLRLGSRDDGKWVPMGMSFRGLDVESAVTFYCDDDCTTLRMCQNPLNGKLYTGELMIRKSLSEVVSAYIDTD